MFENIPSPYQNLYIWDSMEKRGFPMSEHIKCIHMSPEKRALIASGNTDEIDAFIQEFGINLEDLMMEVLKTFTALLISIYADQTDEKRQEILSLIRQIAGQ